MKHIFTYQGNTWTAPIGMDLMDATFEFKRVTGVPAYMATVESTFTYLGE